MEVQGKKESHNILCSLSPQNMKLGSSSCSGTKKRDAHAELSVCQSKPIAFFCPSY